MSLVGVTNRDGLLRGKFQRRKTRGETEDERLPCHCHQSHGRLGVRLGFGGEDSADGLRLGLEAGWCVVAVPSVCDQRRTFTSQRPAQQLSVSVRH